MPDSTRGRAMPPVSLTRADTPHRECRRTTSVRQDETVQDLPVRPDEPWDLRVVGAGPSGSTAALAALRQNPGARVALVDAATFPRDKSCGDGIAPHCLDELRDLGVSDVTRGYAPVDRLRFRTPSGRDVLAVPPRASYVIPRTVFDARLVDAAVAAGAHLLRGRV